MIVQGTSFWAGLATILLLALLHHWFIPRRLPSEPPYLTSRIPLIGHLIGIITFGAGYYRKLDIKYGLGLYGLPILTGRIYIISSADWAVAAQKKGRAISLELLIAQVWGKLFCIDKKTDEIFKQNIMGEKDRGPSLSIEVHKTAHQGLAPSPELDVVKKALYEDLAARVNELSRGRENEEGYSFGLWAWIRLQLSQATISAFYGKENPLQKNPALVDDFWYWEENTQSLLMLPFPSILARTAYQARKRWFDAWQKYIKGGQYKSASKFVRDRAALHFKFGIADDQYGLAESGMPHAILVNTIPASFWLIGFIFRDINLLAEIRAEINACTRVEGNRRIIHVSQLGIACPLLVSTMKETLRLVAPLHTNRVVAEDTVVSNNNTGESFLLRKGSALQYASTIMHSESEIWGEDVDCFEPRRFLSTECMASRGTSGKRTDPAAPFRGSDGKLFTGSFRAFGGGINLCPGRFFAQDELLAFAALFVAGFEITDCDGEIYKAPTLEKAKGLLFVAVIKPEEEGDVRLCRRQGFEDVEWELEI